MVFTELYAKRHFDVEEEKLKSMSSSIRIIKDGKISDRMIVKRFLMSEKGKSHEFIKNMRARFNKEKNTKCFSDDEIREIIEVKNMITRRFIQ